MTKFNVRGMLEDMLHMQMEEIFRFLTLKESDTIVSEIRQILQPFISQHSFAQVVKEI